MDEEVLKYFLEDWEKLLYFVFLFCIVIFLFVFVMIYFDYEKFFERNGFYFFLFVENVRNYFYVVMKEVDKRFKECYLVYKNYCVVFGFNGKCFYDVYILRV